MLRNSVFNTIKSMLGPSISYDAYDMDIIVHINSALMVLGQLSVVPEGTRIKDETTVWSDILDDRADLEGIKEYIYLKVKMVFDPSGSATIQNSYNERAKELEWRLHAFTDIIGQKQAR